MKTNLKNDKLAKAKASLIVDQPFFATMLLGMNLIIDNSVCETMATDGESVFVNSDFVDSLDVPEVEFVLAHEVMHCTLDHLTRRGERGANRWNQAADYIINSILVTEGVGKMPKIGLLDHNLVKRGGGTAEGVYKLLPAENEKKESGKFNQNQKGKNQQPSNGKPSQQQPGNGQALDKMIEPKDSAKAAKVASDIKIRVIQAANAAKAMGRLSAGMEIFLGEVLESKSCWREQLRRFFSERAKFDYTFARPNRRNSSDEYLTPSLAGERMGAIVNYTDCSGSVDKKLLELFSAELDAIRRDTLPLSIECNYFDTEVIGEPEVFTCDDQVILKPRGGGGTDFAPIFKHIADSGKRPAVCIILTDLYCDSYGDIIPDYPVLWVVLGEVCQQYSKVPFGEIIKIKNEF